MVTASHNTKEYNGYKVCCTLVVTTITKAPRNLSHTSSWPVIVCLVRSAQVCTLAPASSITSPAAGSTQPPLHHTITYIITQNNTTPDIRCTGATVARLYPPMMLALLLPLRQSSSCGHCLLNCRQALSVTQRHASRRHTMQRCLQTCMPGQQRQTPPRRAVCIPHCTASAAHGWRGRLRCGSTGVSVT
jgi:hypothetical protein